MPTITDYVTWRGDLSVAERPFNDVDSLVLSCLSYLDFSGIVPVPGAGADVSLHDACSALLDKAGDDLSPYVRSMASLDVAFVRAVGESRRFGEMCAHGYVDQVDPDETLQFSCLAVDVSSRETYLAFRGTDLTIVGWRENFLLATRVTEAQRRAAEELDLCCRWAGEQGRVLYVGGHSKGGNLASYAVANCPAELLGAVALCWAFDAPGLERSIVARDGWDALGPRFHRVQPGYSFVGQMFDRPEEPRTYVRSSGQAVLQHDPMTWQTTPLGFVPADGLDPAAAALDDAFATWVASADHDSRVTLTQELFDVLSAGGATTLDQVLATPEATQQVLRAANEASDTTKDLVTRLLSVTFEKSAEAAAVRAGKALKSGATALWDAVTEAARGRRALPSDAADDAS